MHSDSQGRLGWPTLLAALAARARTSLGREAARALAPLPSPSAAREQMAHAQTLRAQRAAGAAPPLEALEDPRPALARAGRGGALDGPELLVVQALMASAARLADYLEGEAPGLAEIRGSIAPFGELAPLARRLSKALRPDGSLSDDASPELARIRAKVRGLHGRLRASAEALTQDRAWRDRLQEPLVSVRGDRYVLPVKAAHRAAAGGVVHDLSNTGQTVFIEPPELVAGGNELAVAAAEEAEETRRVLRALTEALTQAGPSLEADLEAVTRLDLLSAIAQLAEDLDAAPPAALEAEGIGFSLSDLRHPLLVLQEKRVIPNEVRLDAQARCLMISGPNAGGKTVTASAIALCGLMARHGLPIPAAPGAQLPFYRDVRAVLGDAQDLHRDLSTFSAHLVELRALLTDAGPGDLLLIDEICADTDPREGAALAAGVLEALVQSGAQVLVTTHFDALKVVAASDPRYLCAAVGFDAASTLPTFRLTLNASAGSSALAVAERVGLPAQVLSHAARQLSGDAGPLKEAMKGLEAAQAEAEAARSRHRAAEHSLEEARAALEAEREALRAARLSLRAEGQAQLLDDIAAARREVTETLRELRAAPTLRRAGASEAKLQQLAEESKVARAVAEEALEAPTAPAPPPPAEGAPLPPDAPLALGDMVRVPTLGDREGEILEIGPREALVGLGALQMRLPLKSLVPLRRAARRAVKAKLATSAAERERRAEALSGGQVLGSVEARGPIDLRGMRVHEALEQVDQDLDTLLREGGGRALFLHGHGSGAIKRALRQHLRTLPYVDRVQPGEAAEGGDAVTAVLIT